MNTLFIDKVKVFVVIRWSYKSHTTHIQLFGFIKSSKSFKAPTLWPSHGLMLF